MSVLPNGGHKGCALIRKRYRLHSMMSVLPNGGVANARLLHRATAALDDVSATEWRF